MASLSPLTLTNIAFKNVIGRALGATSNDWYVETKSSSFNIESGDVWLDTISSTPSIAVNNGVALQVDCDMILIPESGGHAYVLTWPMQVPTGTDIITGVSYSYGAGSLVNINSGDVVRNIIPDKFGLNYLPNITLDLSGTALLTSDPRTWYLQYNSGVFYQDNVITPEPLQASVYVYVGKTLKSQPNTPYTNSNNSENIVGGLLKNNTYTDVTIKSILDMMLYPSLQPAITSFTIQGASNLYEVGYQQPSGTYTMSWVISNTSSLETDSLYIYGTAGNIIYGPTNNSGPIINTFPNLQYLSPITLTYSLSVGVNSGIRITSPFSITWNWGVQYGNATSSLLTTYGGFISYATNLNGTPFGSYTLPGGTPSYKYIFIPDSFSTISNIFWNNIPVVMADSIDGYTWSANNLNYNLVSYNNIWGVTSNYKIYRTKNMITATMTNVIIS